MTQTLAGYDRFLTALCIWREARGQGDDAKRGVLWVINNRVDDKRWPATASGVITQPKQFSSFNPGDPNATLFPLWYDAEFAACCEVVDNPGDDPTKGANAYHSIPPGGHLPAWADETKLTVRIGAFSFYKL